MPGPHRRFLEDLASVANIRDYVDANRHDSALTAAYNECLRSLTGFRDTHLRIVSRYIVIMAQQSKKHLAGDSVYSGTTQNPSHVDMNGTDEGVVLGLAKNEASKKGLKGTGGTKLMPFLKQSRDETIEPTNEPRSKASPKFEGLPVRLSANTPMKSPTCSPKINSLIDDQYAVRWCKVNDFEDLPPARIMGVGMAGNWEVGDDYGGICQC
jgi:indoleamine 2,3-dioxygenase